jgi:hypothetical protein
MFAVIAECFDSEEIYGWSHTPQEAWARMLAEFNRAQHDIDLDTVKFFRFTEDVVPKESKIEWINQEEFDE